MPRLFRKGRQSSQSPQRQNQQQSYPQQSQRLSSAATGGKQRPDAKNPQSGASYRYVLYQLWLSLASLHYVSFVVLEVSLSMMMCLPRSDVEPSHFAHVVAWSFIVQSSSYNSLTSVIWIFQQQFVLSSFGRHSIRWRGSRAYQPNRPKVEWLDKWWAS